jgi:hypothetical protein
MPLAVQLHMFPGEIGMRVNDTGNVEIMGVDRDTGSAVTLEINSQHWKHVYNQMGKMRGIGIHKANRAPIEIVKDMPDEPSH